MNAATQLTHTPRQLALIQNTVAKDCNNDEFNLFVEVARAKGLDPFLGQIIPMIFSKANANKRKMTIIISRDGQRVIAQRCGDYRPASKTPSYELDPELKGPANPHGIVSATVYLWKQDAKTSEWYEVAGQAFWDEFAPLSYSASQYNKVNTGEFWPDGNPKIEKTLKEDAVASLDDSGNWCRMPRLMIAKCAEMQALRAGWPEQFTGLYDEAELDRAKVLDLTASEIVEHEREESRLKLIAGNDAITVTWGDGWALENVPVGQFMDRALAFIKESDPVTISKWADANRDPLRIFWAKSKSDALELKRVIEAVKPKPIVIDQSVAADRLAV
jgi:phage recombination protein Bet